MQPSETRQLWRLCAGMGTLRERKANAEMKLLT